MKKTQNDVFYLLLFKISTCLVIYRNGLKYSYRQFWSMCKRVNASTVNTFIS